MAGISIQKMGYFTLAPGDTALFCYQIGGIEGYQLLRGLTSSIDPGTSVLERLTTRQTDCNYF
jgi:hypothetical protein